MHYTIKDIKLNKYDIEFPHIVATITTKKGSLEIYEWLNDNKVERIDTAFFTNQNDQSRKLDALFDTESTNRSGDDTPLCDIYDALDEFLTNH